MQCRGEFSLSATPVTFPDGVMSTWFFRLWNPAVQTPVRERSTSCGLDQPSPPACLPPSSLAPHRPPDERSRGAHVQGCDDRVIRLPSSSLPPASKVPGLRRISDSTRLWLGTPKLQQPFQQQVPQGRAPPNDVLSPQDTHPSWMGGPQSGQARRPGALQAAMLGSSDSFPAPCTARP